MTLADPAVAAVLASPARRNILDAIAAAERDGAAAGLSAPQLAAQLGLHVTTIRFHVDQLIDVGLVRSSLAPHEGPGRPLKLYALAPEPAAGDQPVDRLALVLAEAVTASLSGGAASPAQAGAAWARQHIATTHDEPAATPGEWLGRVGHMVDVLAGWGYHPEVSTSDEGLSASIELSDCPFLDLARDNQEAVCGVHFGLIRESMARFGEPDTQVDLDPFVTPTRCRAHLRAAPRPT